MVKTLTDCVKFLQKADLSVFIIFPFHLTDFCYSCVDYSIRDIPWNVFYLSAPALLPNFVRSCRLELMYISLKVLVQVL